MTMPGLLKLKSPPRRAHPHRRMFEDIARAAQAADAARRRRARRANIFTALAILGISAWMFEPVALSLWSHGL